MDDKKQKITIKGTKDGLILGMDDTCSYDEVFRELQQKLKETPPQNNEPSVSVTIKSGNRYLYPEQKKEIEELLDSESNFTVHSFESSVVRKEDALSWKDETDIKLVNRIIRSGQVLEITGDLLLIGDVNPGGTIQSTGNIYIMGQLLGIAHAGADGDEDAVIAASYMKPSQLRIAGYISRAPDYESDGVYMEYGYIDKSQNKIMIDQLKVLSRKRVDVSGFERRIQNG